MVLANRQVITTPTAVTVTPTMSRSSDVGDRTIRRSPWSTATSAAVDAEEEGEVTSAIVRDGGAVRSGSAPTRMVASGPPGMGLRVGRRVPIRWGASGAPR
jgi:DNA-binding IclR family transcriptional regulator